MTRLASLSVLALSLLLPSLGLSEDSTSKELNAALKDRIVPTLKKEKINRLSIGPIRWKDGKRANHGAGLAQMLSDLLTQAEIDIVPGADAQLNGTLESLVDPQSKFPVVRLTLTLTYQQTVLLNCPRVIYGEEEVASLEGTKISFAPVATEKQRNAAVLDARKHDSIPMRVLTTRVLSADQKVIAEMLVSQNGEKFVPRTLDREGRVPVQAGETYQIKITNQFDHEIAIKLSIDGLAWDQFANFGEGKSGALILIAPKSSSVIKGWAKDAKSSFKFDVARFPVGSICRPDSIGTITLGYSASWPKDQSPPADEEALLARRSALGTQRVREQQDSFEVTERTLGRVRGVFSIRYGQFE
jgi:hypothetical protein